MEKLLYHNVMFRTVVNSSEKLILERLVYKVRNYRVILQYIDIANIQVTDTIRDLYKKDYFDNCIELELVVSELFKKYNNSETPSGIAWRIDLDTSTIIWFKKR